LSQPLALGFLAIFDVYRSNQARVCDVTVGMLVGIQRIDSSADRGEWRAPCCHCKEQWASSASPAIYAGTF